MDIPWKSTFGLLLEHSRSPRMNKRQNRQICLQYLQFLSVEYFAYTLEICTNDRLAIVGFYRRFRNLEEPN